MNTDSNNREKDLLSTQNIKALISNRDVENILFDHYGLEVTEIKELNGYDDKNFLLKTKYPNEKDHSLTDTTENECVFKVINSLDSKNVKFFEAQDSVLIFLGEWNYMRRNFLYIMYLIPFSFIFMRNMIYNSIYQIFFGGEIFQNGYLISVMSFLFLLFLFLFVISITNQLAFTIY